LYAVGKSCDAENGIKLLEHNWLATTNTLTSIGSDLICRTQQRAKKSLVPFA
jgi:hypothetical protein